MTHRHPLPEPAKAAGLDPIFISVKEAAVLLGLTPWSVYQLCDEGEIVSQYHGKRRLVRLASVRAYADGLPSERESAS